MGSSQIFGFPVTRRKARETSVRPIPQIPTECNVQTVVSDPFIQRHNDGQTSSSGKERPAKHTRSDNPKVHNLGTISVPGMTTGRRTLGTPGDKELEHPLHTIHPKASSQLLGNQDYELSHNSESGIDQTTRRLKFYGSSSTLRSFYDPQKIPLAVSQQTSNSSARDFALRKGCPPVIAVEKPVSRSSQPRKNTEAALKSTKKTSSMRLDLSSLFPKPLARHDPLLASGRGGGHSDITRGSVTPPAVPFGPSTSQIHQHNKANKAHHRLQQSESLAPCLDTAHIMKRDVRNPEGEIKYWFDNLEDEDSEDCAQHETVKDGSEAKCSRDSWPRIDTTPTELKAHDDGLDGIPLRHKRCDPSIGSNISYLLIPSAHEQSTVSPAREKLRLALQNWEFRSKHRRTLPGKNSTAQFRKSRNNPLNGVDLQKNSVLWLSSSDDESEADDSMQSDIGIRVPGIRDSLVVAPSDSSDIEIGTAHAILTKRPKLKTDFARRKDQTRFSQTYDAPLESVQVPERRSSKMFSFLSDQSKSIPNTRGSTLPATPTGAISPEPVNNCLPESTIASQKHDTFIRVMTVTPQEVSLLEAIRSKRASIRHNIVVETFRRTSEEEQSESTSPHTRPRTSALEGNSASFLHLSQDSMRTLSTLHNRRRSISAGEVLGFDDTEPAHSCSTDPKASQHGSLVHSSLPSTSSQESPLTPTVEQEPGNLARRNSSSTKRYSTLATKYKRHSRVRTGSSAVIVLDSLDDDDGSSSHFQFDDLPIWAFNGWPGTPGLAIVH